MTLGMADYRGQFEGMGAVYVRPDLEGAPHINTLKSDTHTTDYFNSDYVVRDPDVMDAVALEWADTILDLDMRPDWVLGHAPFAEIPAYALARALRSRGGLTTQAAYSRLVTRAGAKGGDYATTFPIHPDDEIVLVADDVVTGDSTVKTGKNAESKGGVLLPVIPCLANLSLSDVITFAPDQELPLLAATTFTPTRYRIRAEGLSGERVRCELCVGSQALAPREGDNWAELQRWMVRGRER